MKEKTFTSPITSQDDCCSNTPEATPPRGRIDFKTYLPAVISFVMLISGIAMDYYDVLFFQENWRLGWYIIAYCPVGLPVLKAGWENILKGDFFTEFFLMGIATIGAFALGHYHEGVAVMLFYSVGELFQHDAVKKARGNIQALLEVRPNSVLVLRKGKFISMHPEDVAVGEKIQVRVGEKVPLDGKLLSQNASLNTAAITGESKPSTFQSGENIYAGSINLEGVIEVETTKTFNNSSISRILHLVQEATARKSKTELFIRKFARVYTPIVVFLAIGLTFLPYFFVTEYIFQDWLYRALVFLVISCPCALVISIPLGYFGGLGAASRNGILFKGASFLDAITKINTVVMDKTGTITKGIFKVKGVKTFLLTEKEILPYLVAIESHSTHPIASAIIEYSKDKDVDFLQSSDIQEIAGMGLIGRVNEKTVLVGNKLLLLSNNIEVPPEVDNIVDSVVLLSVDGRLEAYVTIADELKDDTHHAIQQLREIGISNLWMLSGDKPSITEKLGRELDFQRAIGGLLPEDKLREVENLKKIPGNKVAFVGDGINDAPVIAASDVGIAMGALGSDVAIETADIIIQTDHPSKIARAIKIGRSTRRIVWQNIAMAFGVKLFVLILGAGGLATMWEAVFADVGVAFLAILNAIRLQRMHWS